MEKTQANFKLCSTLVDKFRFMRKDFPASDLPEANAILTKHLLAACSRPDIAEEVVEEIVGEHEWYPTPATIRKTLDRLSYVQEDKSKKFWDDLRKEEQEREAA